LLPENISVVKSAGLENEQGEMEISSHVKQFTGMEIIQMEKAVHCTGYSILFSQEIKYHFVPAAAASPLIPPCGFDLMRRGVSCPLRM